MKKTISIILLFIVSVIVISCDVNNNKIKEEAITEKLEKVNSVEEFKKLLNGTTWHYTEPLNSSKIGCWLKVEFSGDEYTFYYANPSDGKWTMDNKGKFEISESRYHNTGEKFYKVTFEGGILGPSGTVCDENAEINFTNECYFHIHSLVLSILIADGKTNALVGKAEYGDYSWD